MEPTVTTPAGKLNPLQISLLRLFDRGMTDEQLLDLRRVLVDYYATQLRDEAERASEQKGYTDNDFTAMLNDPS